jgi:hypothetical protein
MRKPGFRFYLSFSLLLGALLALGLMISCGGGTSMSPTTASTTGTVTTSIGDPSTCSPPNGPYEDVWVTITKVTASTNANAGSNDSGWQTLVDLTSSPMQVELFSLQQTSLMCVLKTLGSTTGLPPGNYQQIRVYLLSNDNPVAGNACSTVSANNCVQVNGNLRPLLLSSEAQTGIKIPSSQITSGGVNLQANQSADININFMACESLVMQGNGGVRLKPVLHAGEVSLNTNTLSGKVVDASSGVGIPNAFVLLEQLPSGASPAIEQIKDSATTDSNGNFFFCPLPEGEMYDVVVAASTWDGTSGVTYNPTVTLQVPVGSNLGNIPLTPETPATGSVLTPPATLTGQITTTAADTGTTPAATDNTAAVVSLTALQSTGGGTPALVIVPIFSSDPAPPNVTTVAGTTTEPCPSGTDCANYSIDLPGSNPVVGTFSSSSTGTDYAPAAANPAVFWILATAVTPATSTTPSAADCSPSSLPATFDSTTQVSLDPGTSNPAYNIAFTGCTSGF